MEERSLKGIVVGVAIAMGGIIVWGPRSTNAAWIESLVMPGEVVEGHASFETECESCHARFKQAEQDRLCLACHEDVAADLAARRGMHGRAPKAREPCKLCHSEHKGRRANIVPLDRGTFDHHRTDFALREAHIRVSCEDCHQAGTKYRAAPSDCIGCHRGVDAHEGGVGEACDRCHSEHSWQHTQFDHAAAAFQLRGKHRTVACDGCHSTARYTLTPSTCGACHADDDTHGGEFGSRCERCHGVDGWTAIAFDHSRDAGFALDGRHAGVSCAACHEDGKSAEDTPRTCEGCHASDDAHRGRFGPKCGDCHTPKSWAAHTFDHDARTTFALRGEHVDARCVDCHRGDLFGERLDPRCHACHEADDVHRGQEGEACDRCHDTRGWREHVLFNHALTRFPLVGKHALVACEECHPSKAFKDTSLECTACHDAVDPHGGGLPRCQDCHNPSDWSVWDFDHDIQTTFALDGAHERVACKTCHPGPAMGTSTTPRRACGACHEADDVHNGEFGRACERCHVTTSFRVLERVR